MSRYHADGYDPCHQIMVGFTRRTSTPTFFALVTERREHARPDENSEQSQARLIWQIGGTASPLTDLQKMVAALTPYGKIPLLVQLRLLCKQDAHLPLPLTAFGEQLAAICQQAPTARLAELPQADVRSWLLLDEQGWHLRPWDILPAHEPMAAFPQLLFPGQPVRPETATVLRNDHSIQAHVHTSGLLHGLPILALLARGGALAGPVAITGDAEGLTAAQVGLVQHEVFFIEESLRLQVSLCWYHAWTSLRGRGWHAP